MLGEDEDNEEKPLLIQNQWAKRMAIVFAGPFLFHISSFTCVYCNRSKGADVS